MDELVGTYYDEWAVIANDPERQKQFRQFVNTVLRHLSNENSGYLHQSVISRNEYRR